MIELTDWLRAELVRRADREAPLEACGLISRAASDARVSPGRIALWEAENAAEQPETSFLIAPQAQFDLLASIERYGHTLAGIYHSHAHSGPEPSERDRAIAAGWPGLTWVIVGRVVCPNCNEGTVTETITAYEADGTPYPEPSPAPCPTCNSGGTVPDFWAGEL